MTDNTQSAARWYMVTHDGVATLCEDLRDAEKEAKDADMAWPHSGPHRAVQLVEVGTAAAELHQLHARIAELESRVQELGAMARENRSRRIVELEAQLEAFWAGGVSGPLMGKPQEMTDLTKLTERGAKAWAGVDAQALREGGASAGSEPVAGAVLDDEGSVCLIRRGTEREYIARRGGSLLYTHPSPPEGMVGGWIALPGALPEPGVPVLLDIGKKYPIRALWAAKHTVEAADDDTDWAEYDEATETYYCPEGWYEWNQCEDNHWRVTETPCAWAPLPPTSSADSRKGE